MAGYTERELVARKKMTFTIKKAKSAGKEAKLRGMKLFVTDPIEERTVLSGEYRRGVASAHKILAAGGS
jgi:hypothetical protein